MVAISALFSVKQDKWDAVFGGLMVVALFGWFFFNGRRRKVLLGGGRLWVGASRGQETLVDAVAKVGRRRWLGAFPVVFALTISNDEIDWPCHGAPDDVIEHALNVAIMLRQSGATGAVHITTDRAVKGGL
jgi:hypothetical protein